MWGDSDQSISTIRIIIGITVTMLISPSAPQMFTILRVIQLNRELRTDKQTNKRSKDQSRSHHLMDCRKRLLLWWSLFLIMHYSYLCQLIRCVFFQKLHSRMTYCTSFYRKSQRRLITYVSYVPSTSLYQTDGHLHQFQNLSRKS